MYSDSDLDAAVAAGVLSPEAAARFRAFVAGGRQTSVADEEHFRLLTGFNDIFVAIAIALILVAVTWIGRSVGPGLSSGFAAVASWGLAEFFTRKRRMALPSILLLLGFALGTWTFSFSLFSGMAFHGAWDVPRISARVARMEWPALAAAATTTLLVYAHWRRFMVPITVAAGVAALLVTVFLAAFMLFPALRGHEMPLLLIGGVVVFAIAMWWDASDPARRSRRSDVAFWLHLMAAPMLVHPAFTMLGLLGGGAVAPGRAIAVIAIYVMLGVVALAIDRRALLVSALAYVLSATSALFKAAGSAGLSFALTALIIGSLLLLLSAFWHSARRPLIASLPASLRVRLPAG